MYLSVKEAAKLSGKSTTTIYRLCNKRINTKYIIKEDNKFKIRKDFLLASYPNEAKDEKTEIEQTNNESLPKEHKVIDLPKSTAKTTSNNKEFRSSLNKRADELIDFEFDRIDKSENGNSNNENQNNDDNKQETVKIETEKQVKIQNNKLNQQNENSNDYLTGFVTKELIKGVGFGLFLMIVFLYALYLLS